MRTQRVEVVRLCRVALQRPRWQQVVAFVVSSWTLAWILGHYVAAVGAPTALGVLGGFGSRVGFVDGRWADQLAVAWHEGGGALVVLGGLLWAATTERGQAPALLGWVAVMLGAERVGYRPAILFALATMIGFVAVLWAAAQLARHFGFTTLLPPDVLRAGVTAAALSAVVPLFAPMLFLSRLGRPYLTRGPRVIPSARSGDDPVAEESPRSSAG
ncbi:hypothetical protein GCM10009854_29030 [Saccharopolyspora halophila]|uniref:Rod shape-determining protein MreD n=1 Tax=Saccharopolyspora halophila TaxID=405551 RepID=A0ABN3GEH3_9PSEU